MKNRKNRKNLNLGWRFVWAGGYLIVSCATKTVWL